MKSIIDTLDMTSPRLFIQDSVRRILSCGIAFLVFSDCSSLAQETFYYKKGKKIPLQTDKSKTFALFAPETTKAAVESATKPVKATLKRFEALQEPDNLNLVVHPSPVPSKWAVIDNNDIAAQPLNQASVASKVGYKAPFFLTADKKQVGMSHLVYVKLKAPEDRVKLEAIAKELKVEVVGNNKQMPLWFTLACTKESSGNSLEVANKIFESGGFAAAEPDFLADFQIKDAAPSCAEDSIFAKQWALKNTGQSGGAVGLDIGICSAWTTATGKGITVAVIDQGVELDHPDLAANISPKSFDTENGTSPSKIRGRHGTACAGIVAAMRNNMQRGLTGAAPDSKLMSVSDKLSLEPGAQQRLASGISWAWQNGADIISNSWGHDLLASPLIDDAIEDALTKGREGKGCVVVFAAGNNNGPVLYPANSNPAILTVGAMSPCGQRKSPTSCDGENWGSCFGGELDVMAPGVLIPTTDLSGPSGYDSGDFTLTFNGTSSATPHVAAVAALILEINPNWKQEQVVRIIEQTARKEGPYSYQAIAGRPNGDWDREAGYGLVNAKMCVEVAKQGAQDAGQ